MLILLKKPSWKPWGSVQLPFCMYMVGDGGDGHGRPEPFLGNPGKNKELSAFFVLSSLPSASLTPFIF